MTKNRPVILIVDDDEHALQILRVNLIKKGYTVITASRSAYALEILESREGALVKLVLIELAMPGIDGVELANHISLMRSDIKILVISDQIDHLIIHDDLIGHNIGFLNKSLIISKLHDSIKSLFF